MKQELTVVVTGSTGNQGGAVARGLLERGHKVRAVTRDPNSSQAKSLANAGATLVAASLEDTVAITKALEGATSLFAMTTPFGGGVDAETRHDVVAILSRVIGRPFAYYQVPLDVIRQGMGEDGARMYEWFDRVGFTVDRAALRREFPDVAFHDFEFWAKTQDWNALLQQVHASP